MGPAGLMVEVCGGQRSEQGRHRFAAITHLHPHAQRFGGGLDRHPVDGPDDAVGASGFGAGGHDHPIHGGIEADHVQRFTPGHAEALALPNGEMLDAVVGVLGALGHVVPALAEKAELARIGRYYATESMLVLDPQTGRYDAAATPSTGTETLFDFYAGLVSGARSPERGDHAVF